MKRWLAAAKRHRARVVGGSGAAPDTTVNAGQSSFTSDDYDFLANSTDTATLTITARNAAGGVLSGKTATISRETIAVSAANSIVDVSPAVMDADGVSSATVTLTLRDGSNRPIPNIPASDCVVAVTGSGNTVTQPTGSTNQLGQITGSFVSTVAGTKVCSFTVRGTAITDTASCVVGSGGGSFPIPTVNNFYNSTEFEMSGGVPVNSNIVWMDDHARGWGYKANAEGRAVHSGGPLLFTSGNPTVGDAIALTAGYGGTIFGDNIPEDSGDWTPLGMTGILVDDATAWGSGADYAFTYGSMSGSAGDYSNYMGNHELATPSGELFVRWRRYFPSDYLFGAEKICTINPPDWELNSGIYFCGMGINIGAGSNSTTGTVGITTNWDGTLYTTSGITLQQGHVYDIALYLNRTTANGTHIIRIWIDDLGTPGSITVPSTPTRRLNVTNATITAVSGGYTTFGNVWLESWSNPVSFAATPGSQYTNVVAIINTAADTTTPVNGRGA